MQKTKSENSPARMHAAAPAKARRNPGRKGSLRLERTSCQSSEERAKEDAAR